jgi:hypothetical protein
MPQPNKQYLHWQVPEYRVPERSRTWYILASVFILGCIFFSLFRISEWKLVFLSYDSNFLFILILIMSAAIMYVYEKRPPEMINFELGPEGIKIGGKFYDYDDIKNFCVLYKPKQSIKQLYFEFKTSARQRLSIPLRRMDALTVRNFLIRYLDEDLERTNKPLSEQLTKLLKL